MYAESCQITEMNLQVDLELVFKKIDDKNCIVTWRFINTSEIPLTEATSRIFFDRLKTIMDELKDYSEKMEASFLEPLIK